jgi:hypothetical protein
VHRASTGIGEYLEEPANKKLTPYGASFFVEGH